MSWLENASAHHPVGKTADFGGASEIIILGDDSDRDPMVSGYFP